MRCIQDAPYGGVADYFAIRFRHGSAIATWTIDLSDQTGSKLRELINCQIAKGWQPIFDESCCAWRMTKQIDRERIIQSVRGKQPRRTLLSVQAVELYRDDLDVNDYWQADWKRTVEILREIL